MKVFVTGASGFVGEEILRQLHTGGHAIRILARNPHSEKTRELAARFQAGIYGGNVVDGASLASALLDIEAVIHLAGIISEARKKTFENVHTLGTQNIVAVAKKAGVKRFIQMSALGTRANAVARYHRSKWAAEEIVRQSGMDYTIFRPSIIYGPHDHFVNLFAKMARFSAVLPVVGNGRNKMQPIPVTDVAKCFVGALTEPKSIGHTYDLCGPEALSFNEILKTILKVTGHARLRLHLPMPLAWLQAAMLELIFAVFGKAPPLNRDQLRMLKEDNVGNPQPANELFRLMPVPFAEGIAQYLRH